MTWPGPLGSNSVPLVCNSIGKNGKVVWHFTEVDSKIRPSNEDIRAALRKVRD